MAFRELLFTNFRRKLFALLLAIMVWVTIHFLEIKKQSASPVRNPSTNDPSLNP